MKLILKRIAKRKGYTIGKLYLCNESKPPLTGGGLEGWGGKFPPPTGGGLEGAALLCDTLEPPCIEMKTDRSIEEVLNDKTWLKSIKPCAIPEGEYKVSMTYSPRYKTQLPLITGDSRFNSLWQGIRIHAGNTAEDTQGCILVGQNKIVGMLINSRLALKKVIAVFQLKVESVELIVS